MIALLIALGISCIVLTIALIHMRRLNKKLEKIHKEKLLLEDPIFNHETSTLNFKITHQGRIFLLLFNGGSSLMQILVFGSEAHHQRYINNRNTKASSSIIADLEKIPAHLTREIKKCKPPT